MEKKTEPASIDKLLAISTFDPPAATTATEKAVESDLSQTRHDIDIPLNKKVLSYIELFQGNLREFITEGLMRGQSIWRDQASSGNKYRSRLVIRSLQAFKIHCEVSRSCSRHVAIMRTRD